MNESGTFTFTPELRIEVVSRCHDPLNNPAGTDRVDYTLAIPCPEPSSQSTIHFAHQPPQPEPLRKDLWQIEDFFANMGLELPSRTKAKQLVKDNEKLRADVEGYKVQMLTQRNSTNDMLLRLQEELAKWRDYAVALDADRRARNFSVSKKVDALDPRKAK